ncbi:DUF4038 domain-containing protein [Nonomuraea sp. NPDC049129]|uniref:apiosidase-like domain-containing protein n=1 Tax=Nonomuraea sp. NPDC049129 TaxID=3155272 RepID=UPI0033DBD4C5
MPTATPWWTNELAFEAAREHVNPYRDLDVQVVFTGPGDVQVRRPAFWDGGRTWRVRFAPTAPGRWSYRTTCGDTSDHGLHHRTGELECRLEETDRPIYRHGFLRRGPDGRFLAHADGTPFFWLGDTHWQLMCERWDEANKPGWSSQFRDTVDLRVRQGFTVYQTNLMVTDKADSDWAGTASYWLEGREFEDIDVDYFKTAVDLRLAYIAERGLVNALGLGWYSVIDRHLEGVQRFARYVVARYGSYPVVWTLGGEVAGYEPELRQDRIDAWREVALTIRAADGYRHPITAHATAERPIVPYYQDEDWLDLTLNQHAHGDFDLSTDHYRAHLATHPGRPLVEGESLYEGLLTVERAGRRPVTETMVRQIAYRAMQSGCCGYTYGAQGCWNAAWEPGERASMWGDMPWREGVDLPGAEQLGHLRRFYEEVGWSRLRPDPCCFRATYIHNNHMYAPSVSADEDMTTVVAHFGETYRMEGRADFVGLRAVPYRLDWFDPREGHWRVEEERAEPVGGTLAVPAKPDGRDWLLVARSEDDRSSQE